MNMSCRSRLLIWISGRTPVLFIMTGSPVFDVIFLQNIRNSLLKIIFSTNWNIPSPVTSAFLRWIINPRSTRRPANDISAITPMNTFKLASLVICIRRCGIRCSPSLCEETCWKRGVASNYTISACHIRRLIPSWH